MPTRMTLFVPAILATCLATICLTVQASRAAEDCLSKPNAPSPQGTHWYYRVDRATHRECWYLGAEGTKVRVHVRQAASPVRPPPSKPMALSNAQPRAQAPVEAVAPEAVAPEAVTSEAAPGEITAAEVRAAPDDATAEQFMRWSGLPRSAASLARAPVSMGNSYAEEQPPTDSQDDMPLIWPILTAQDLAAAEQAPQNAIPFAQLAAALAAVLGLAALIIRIIFQLTAARTQNRPNAGDRWGSAAPRGMARSTVKATSARAVDVEASVRLLLHELQRRQHAHQRRDFQPTSRQAVA
jgi:hypothetical protein